MDKRFDGFSINLFSDESKDYMAYFVELPEISASGATPELALAKLEKAWDLVKEAYKATKKQIPVAPATQTCTGKISLRISKELHRRLLVQAKIEGLSLNGLINKIINSASI